MDYKTFRCVRFTAVFKTLWKLVLTASCTWSDGLIGDLPRAIHSWTSPDVTGFTTFLSSLRVVYTKNSSARVKQKEEKARLEFSVLRLEKHFTFTPSTESFVSSTTDVCFSSLPLLVNAQVSTPYKKIVSLLYTFTNSQIYELPVVLMLQDVSIVNYCIHTNYCKRIPRLGNYWTKSLTMKLDPVKYKYWRGLTREYNPISQVGYVVPLLQRCL